ncbi:MAG: GrpB family protein [Ruminococcaceae bacterium]|nr:GrpB family protein [Oscillospiraceae bacterium]
MKKELSEMSLEELWKLFPIFLVPHNEKWADDYRKMETFLQTILSDFPVKRISHIGSTAIPQIWAKNIVDILVEVSDNTPVIDVSNALKQNGFLEMYAEEKRIALNKGYTKNGFADSVYHVHLRYIGDNDELYFRDYMTEYPQIAKEYQSLKLTLWKKFEHNRSAYTDAKTDFIRKWTAEAREKYKNRY